MSDESRVVLLSLLPREERANCLGLGYLKAYADARPEITAGARVEILDLDAETPCEEVVRLVGRARLVGLVLNLCNLVAVRAVSRALRERHPDLFLVLGAQEASLRPEELLTELDADAVVLGEGEASFAELLGAVIRGGSLDAVPGLVLRDARGCRRTAPRAPIADLAEIPSPYLSGFYPWPGDSGAESVLETSRGCPYECGFCSWPNGVAPRLFPMERVESEISVLLSRSPSGLVHLSDPDLFLHPERARRVLRHIRRLDPQLRSRWWFNTYLGHMDDAMAALCDHPGFIIECGIQTVNPAALRAAGRRFDAAKVRRGFQALLRGAPRSKVYLQLILGLPGDDLRGFIASLDWCYGLGTDRVHIFPMQLLRGTDFHRRAQEFGIVADPLPPYLVSSTAAFSSADLRRARRAVYGVQFLMRHEATRTALLAAGGSLTLRAESLCAYLGAHGIEMEKSFAVWEEAGSRYLTPLTAGSDPCPPAWLTPLARGWAEETPEAMSARRRSSPR